jgi:hypothetical protein
MRGNYFTILMLVVGLIFAVVVTSVVMVMVVVAVAVVVVVVVLTVRVVTMVVVGGGDGCAAFFLFRSHQMDRILLFYIISCSIPHKHSQSAQTENSLRDVKTLDHRREGKKTREENKRKRRY